MLLRQSEYAPIPRSSLREGLQKQSGLESNSDESGPASAPQPSDLLIATDWKKKRQQKILIDSMDKKTIENLIRVNLKSLSKSLKPSLTDSRTDYTDFDE
ncbi:MAG: hypothetical protein ACRBC3_01935 [Burkholderiaceae bacterium]